MNNGRQNHCGGHLTCYNMDGREFIRELVEKNVAFTDVIINLPQTAVDFLDVFIGIGNFRRVIHKDTNSKDDKESPLTLTHPLPAYPSTSTNGEVRDITIHVYTFSSAGSTTALIEADVIHRVALVLHCSSDIIRQNALLCHVVRDVSPKKHMACLSFRLPVEVIFGASP